MTASFSTILPPEMRRRGEVIGLVCGLFCFPIAFFASSLGAVLPAGPPGVILPMAFFSALAGIIAFMLTPPDTTEPASFALRCAIRAGLVATLAGGALTVFASTLHGFGIGHPTEMGVKNTPLALIPTRYLAHQILIITLCGVPPSIFFGISGALLAAMLRSPRPTPNADGEAVAAKPAPSLLFVCVLALSAIGFLSPFTLSLRPKPKAIVAPPVVEAPAPEPVAAPKWHYEKPDGFDTAEAGRITVVDRRILGEIESSLPVALSPNGRLFACFRRAPQLALEVRNLDTLDVVARADGVDEPAGLSWSPDGKMLLFSVESKLRQLFVFDPTSSRLMLLPQPKNAHVPGGHFRWWDADEVLFVSDSLATLNLDNLRVRPTDGSPKWKALAKERQDEFKAMPSHLPSCSRWQMRLTSAVRGYDVPLNTQTDWPYRESLQLAFLVPEKAYRSVQNEVDAALNDALVAAADGTKLVRIRNRQAMIFYFGIRAESPTRFKASMPSAPDAALADGLAKKSVCAFVCAPLVNPLNGKTVGPDRERVKAIARIATWKDKDAEFWIAEDYFPIQPGDVVADLHTWEARVPHGAGELAKSEWFAIVDKLDARAAPPASSDAPQLDRESTLHFTGWRGADQVIETVPAKSRPQPVPASPEKPPPQKPPVVPDEQKPASIPETPKAPPVPKEQKPALTLEVATPIIRRFIVEHYDKLNRRDMAGLGHDFSESVEFYGQGMLSKARILGSIPTVEPPAQIVEKVAPNIMVAQRAATTFEARCEIEKITYLSGQQVRSVAATQFYTISMGADGAKITKLQSTERK